MVDTSSELRVTRRATTRVEKMGTTELLAAGDPYTEATAMELWAAGELHDEAGSGGTALVVGGMTGLLVALAAFFVAFAPGA
jgi:hypothetical protein